MIVIVDYGMGNLLSVHKALAKVGYASEISSDPKKVLNAEGIILPGVGSFADAINNLKSKNLDRAIIDVINSGKPFLGICLGLHLLFSKGYEYGEHKGLDIISGEVFRLPAGVKVPHMGWNQIELKKECPVFSSIKSSSFFYFVHSYYALPDDENVIVSTTTYGREFTSAVNKENVTGIQFHPEKSSDLGLKILKNFGELVNSANHSGD